MTSISADGICYGPEARPPDPGQVEVCREFIATFYRPTKTIRRGWGSSYGLKHEAERWSRHRGGIPYVSNGAFIEAARQAGIRFVPIHPGSMNAYFALTLRAAP